MASPCTVRVVGLLVRLDIGVVGTVPCVRADDLPAVWLKVGLMTMVAGSRLCAMLQEELLTSRFGVGCASLSALSLNGDPDREGEFTAAQD